MRQRMEGLFKYFCCEVCDMKKAASVFLRADITLRDVDRMIRWMENPNVTRFLNEDADIVYFLRQLSDSVPEPMLGYHFRPRRALFHGLSRKRRQRRLCPPQSPAGSRALTKLFM